METINKILSRPGDAPAPSRPPSSGTTGAARRTPGTLTDRDRTIINAKLTGSLNIEEADSETRLTLYGQLEGDLTCDSISIVQSGTMDGTLTANHVTISGRYSGTVDSEHLTIKPGATVRGILRVRKSIVIEPDADFQGQLVSAEETEKAPLAPLPLKANRAAVEPGAAPADAAPESPLQDEPLQDEPAPAAPATDIPSPVETASGGEVAEKEAVTGEVPPGMAVPDGTADDLKRISGVGPKIEKLLNGLGVFHYRQIAAWTEANVLWVDDFLGFKGRIRREDWIRQAERLAEGETGSRD